MIPDPKTLRDISDIMTNATDDEQAAYLADEVLLALPPLLIATAKRGVYYFNMGSCHAIDGLLRSSHSDVQKLAYKRVAASLLKQGYAITETFDVPSVISWERL